MSKRKILVDGEVRLVSNSEWLKHQSGPKTTKKPKLSIKDVQVEADPVNIEPKEQDHNTLED
jgi:hypothetical protein